MYSYAIKTVSSILCVVVDNNSFTLAATEQYVSQSAISQQIKVRLKIKSLVLNLMVRGETQLFT